MTKPTSITSHPFLTNVSETILEMCLPDLRASLPTKTTCFNLLEIISEYFPDYESEIRKLIK